MLVFYQFMPKGTIADGNRDFTVSGKVARQYDGIAYGPGILKLKWKPKTDVGDGMFLWNIPLHGELTEEQLLENLQVMKILSEAALRGIEK